MYTRIVVPVVVLVFLAACGTSSAPEPLPGHPSGHTPAPGAAPAPVGAAPAGSPEAPAAAGGKLALSGTITYDGAFTGTGVFVSVKDPANPGPPLAAKQLPPGPFPLAFELSEADVVQMGAAPRAMPATVALTVRFDMDGNAMSKDPSEPMATLETPATASGLAVPLAAAPH